MRVMKHLLHFICAFALFYGLWLPIRVYAQEDETHILAILWRADTRIEVAWRAAMQESGLSHKISTISADQDRGRLINGFRAMYKNLFNGDVDLICCFGTTACQVTKQVIMGRVPMLFIGVVDPIGAGLVSSLTLPGHKTSGVTLGVPIDQQLSMLHQISPFRSLLFLFNSREAYSVLIGHELAMWTQEKGLQIEERRVVPDSVGLDEVLSGLFTGDFAADALYVADDSYVASRAQEIAETVGTKTLLFAGSDEFIRAGWLAGWVPSSEKIGQAAAQMSLEVLRDGLDPGIISVRIPQPSLLLNKETARSQGINIPKTSSLSSHIKYITP